MSKRQDAVILYRELKNSVEVAKQLNVPDRTVRWWVKQDNCSADPIAVGYPQRNFNLKDGIVIDFSDSHILPKQDLSLAAKALLLVLKDLKPNIVVNGGDTIDFASISRHEKLGWNEQFTIKEELEAAADFLKMVQKATPGSKFIHIAGNHDDRFNKILANKMPQFKGVKGFNLIDHIPSGWEYLMAMTINNNTMFLHAINGGVHAGYNNVMKAGMSVITGHTHQLEVKPYTDYKGTRYGVQTGTLATIQNNPLFAYTMGSPLNWMAGFVVLTYVNSILQFPEVCSINSEGQAFFRGKILNL